jgi:hypothetical protein
VVDRVQVMSISFQLSAPKKRKSPVAAAFEGKQVDDEAVAAVAKRPALLLEDNVAKSKRLQDAGYILVEAGLLVFLIFFIFFFLLLCLINSFQRSTPQLSNCGSKP